MATDYKTSELENLQYELEGTFLHLLLEGQRDLDSKEQDVADNAEEKIKSANLLASSLIALAEIISRQKAEESASE